MPFCTDAEERMGKGGMGRKRDERVTRDNTVQPNAGEREEKKEIGQGELRKKRRECSVTPPVSSNEGGGHWT